MHRLFIVACCLVAVCSVDAAAQSNEISFSAGGGTLVADRNVSVPVFALTYSHSITSRIAAEGSIDGFYVHGDDFLGVQAAGVYHFADAESVRRVIPFVTAGVGSTSTDATEINSKLVVRLGGGVKYFVTESLGVRVEVRDEIVHTSDDPYFTVGGPVANLPSARVGVIFRF